MIAAETDCGADLSERKALSFDASVLRGSSTLDTEWGMKGLSDAEELLLLDNTRRNAKRAREGAADLQGRQEASAPKRTGKRQRGCPGPVRFTPHTQVRVVSSEEFMDETERCPIEPDERHKEYAQQHDFMVTARMVDGPPLVATVTSNLVMHVAQMSGFLFPVDITSYLLQSVYTTLAQFGVTNIPISEEVGVLNSVCRRLQSLVLAIEDRGSVGLLPGTMTISTAGLLMLTQLKARLQQAIFAVVARGSLCRGAILESRKTFAQREGTGSPQRRTVPNDASCGNSTLSLPSKAIERNLGRVRGRLN